MFKQSIYHVTYMRGLFPDAHFKGIDMLNLDGEIVSTEYLFHGTECHLR